MWWCIFWIIFNAKIKWKKVRKTLGFISSVQSFRGCPRGVMVKAIDCGIVVSEFTLLCSLSGKYPWERYEPPYPPSYGLNSTTTVLLGE